MISSKACASTPAFITIYVKNAFLNRTASRLKPSKFKQLDRAYINNVSHKEVRKYRWKKLSIEEKYKAIYNMMRNPTEYQ